MNFAAWTPTVTSDTPFSAGEALNQIATKGLSEIVDGELGSKIAKTIETGMKYAPMFF
jgi:hypothetical protein